MSTNTRMTPRMSASTQSAIVPTATRPAPSTDPVRRGVESPSQPLDSSIRTSMEQRLGHGFADIRIHAGPAAADSARSLGAEAYMAGRDLVFGPGRYNPSSPEGQRLLAHELAHAAHGATAKERRPGVAPDDALAEHEAQRAADRAVAAEEPVSIADRFHGWGPAWSIHRQVTKSKTKGKVEHTGEVGRLPGEVGVPYGQVEVRTGEEIELKGGGRIPNMIALQYSGLLSADMKWLQFVWFELTAPTPKGLARITGSVPTSTGTKPFTTDPTNPNWSVDSDLTTDPFYEGGGGANLRTKSSTTVFDDPGGGSVTPLADAVFNAGVGATSVTFTAHFETYLIRSDSAVYVVGWQGSTTFTRVKGTTTPGAIGYTVGTSGPVAGMPADRQKLTAASYPKLKTIK